MSNSLRNAFEFGDDDLAANRQGKISDWQRRRLRDLQSKAQRLFLFPVSLPIIFVLFGKGSTLLGVLLGALAVYVVYTTYIRWHSLDVESKMTDGVQSIHGWVTRQRVHSRRGDRYTMEINGSQFKLTIPQYDSLTDHSEYRVYYVPLSQTILSLESEASEFNRPGQLGERLGTL